MVTAGVYLLMRVFPVICLSSPAMIAIAAVGGLTALYAACAALAQKDIKRVLAYSTISQVGYMFLAVGAGDIVGSMFHLLTHAFFKALLFMTAGCIIQALHEEHDIFKMGNLLGRVPALFWVFLAGALALGAVPPTAGFFSKDRILLATLIHPGLTYICVWALAAVTAFLTPLYTFRLFFLVFLERPSSSERDAVKPLPRMMIWILWPLALLSLCSGVLNLPAIWHGQEWLANYIAPGSANGHDFEASSALEWAMELGSALLSLAGLAVAYALYGLRKHLVLSTAWDSARRSVRELFFGGWYLDRLYHVAIVRPYQILASFSWNAIDEAAIDNGFDRAAKVFPLVSKGFRLCTTGRISSYLKMLFMGCAVILSILFVDWYLS
jgi:NADH-quinone oxidoreductase subunit L